MPIPVINRSRRIGSDSQHVYFRRKQVSWLHYLFAKRSTAKAISGFPDCRTTPHTEIPASSESHGASSFPDLPNLSVSYQQGSNDYSLYGAEGDSTRIFGISPRRPATRCAASCSTAVIITIQTSYRSGTVSRAVERSKSKSEAIPIRSGWDTSCRSMGVFRLRPAGRI